MPDVTFATVSAAAPPGAAAGSPAPATDRLAPGSTADRASNAHMPNPLFPYIPDERASPRPAHLASPRQKNASPGPLRATAKTLPALQAVAGRGGKSSTADSARLKWSGPSIGSHFSRRSYKRFGRSPGVFRRHRGSHRNSAATSSAICAVLRAAPLRRLSPQTKSSSAVGSSSARRTRPTQVGSVPTTSDGVGNSPASGSS